MSFTPEQIAYLAGVIDAQACFCIRYSKRKNHYLQVCVFSTSQNFTTYLKNAFGGAVYEKSKKYAVKHKKIYEWYLLKEDIDNFLPMIRPFLKQKNEHADIALEFRKTFPKKWEKVSDEVFLIREELRNHMQFLNKKGM